jgi:hypothetical protein
MQEMFNNFFYKTFTIQQELILLFENHFTDYQMDMSKEIGFGKDMY